MTDFDKLKRECLIYDIETWAEYNNGKDVNINADFESYILLAECKWIGMYSYKYNKYFSFQTKGNLKEISKIIRDHKFLVGHNSEEFDRPICENNCLIDPSNKQLDVDIMQILGNPSFKNKKGFSYKGRGELMNYDFPNNKLRTFAEIMGISTQKGDIDYKIFKKNSWTEEETIEIEKYLESDVLATKEIFDELWKYWMPFTDLLCEKDIKNLSWIRSSIASVVYKSACLLMGIEPIYGEGGKKEKMGGNVIKPKLEDKAGVWYLDFASLYPHIMCMFNLFGETDKDDPNAWHGNDLFKVKGYYNISTQHTLSKKVQEKLKQRSDLKVSDPKNPMIYTLKIWLNGLYGVIRSSIFAQIHTENCGWDTCWLGQQIQEYFVMRMNKFGFKEIGGDTDSIMVYTDNKDIDKRDFVEQCINTIVEEIFANVPFKVPTFKIDIENRMDYVMFPFSMQEILHKDIRDQLNKGLIEGYIEGIEDNKKTIIDVENQRVVKKGRSWVKHWQGKKKNYLYVYTDKDNVKHVELVGLPIKKNNASLLGMKIYNEVLKDKIIKENNAKFDEKFIKELIKEYLKQDGIIESLSIEYKVKTATSYKKETQIHAQVSKEYFNGGDGIIRLVKNKKVGNVGKGSKYCSIEEAKEANLTIDDLDLDKVYNEIDPFIKKDYVVGQIK